MSVARADDDSMRREMRVSLAQMESTTARLRGVLQAARNARDSNKIACVNDALNRADVMFRRGKEAQRAAENALAREDGAAARLFANEVGLDRDAVKEAAKAAGKCTGAPDATVVIVTRAK